MPDNYKLKIFLLLVILLLIFSAIFILALLNPEFNFMDLGLPNNIENKIIAIFSFFSLLLVVWNMRKI